ncbi:hypothetical protein [Ralstonia sp. 24A2]|uniref:hypothetical protein n=1 Tax=Ralstonia sp. 24A2 TaxID=3447364 RepID=UPI003F69CC83
MAMVRMFAAEWRAFAGAAQASHAEAPTLSGMDCAEHARLQRKWVRKQIGLAIVAAGAMIMFLHGMVQLTA